MASFNYKRDTVTQLKVVGEYDSNTMNVTDNDGVIRNIKSLFAEFEGANVEIVIKEKQSEELDEPQADEE